MKTRLLALLLLSSCFARGDAYLPYNPSSGVITAPSQQLIWRGQPIGGVASAWSTNVTVPGTATVTVTLPVNAYGAVLARASGNGACTFSVPAPTRGGVLLLTITNSMLAGGAAGVGFVSGTGTNLVAVAHPGMISDTNTLHELSPGDTETTNITAWVDGSPVAWTTNAASFSNAVFRAKGPTGIYGSADYGVVDDYIEFFPVGFVDGYWRWQNTNAVYPTFQIIWSSAGSFDGDGPGTLTVSGVTGLEAPERGGQTNAVLVAGVSGQWVPLFPSVQPWYAVSVPGGESLRFDGSAGILVTAGDPWEISYGESGVLTVAGYEDVQLRNAGGGAGLDMVGDRVFPVGNWGWTGSTNIAGHVMTFTNGILQSINP